MTPTPNGFGRMGCQCVQGETGSSTPTVHKTQLQTGQQPLHNPLNGQRKAQGTHFKLRSRHDKQHSESTRDKD